MNKTDNKFLLYSVYSVIITVVFALLFWLGHFGAFLDFINKIEYNSFDLRQSVVSKYKIANKDIVILSVDDATYEYIMDKYGSWPISRKVWADVINELEKANPKYIIFDMLFLKPNMNDIASDKALIDAVKNNDNVLLSMNFDNYSDEIRKSPEIPDKFRLKVNQGSLKDNDFITFINARTVMDELEEVTKNIGLINVTRDLDGIIRNTTPVFRYKGEYYPHLSLLAALDLYKSKGVTLEPDKIVIDDNHIIKLDKTQRAILNWYGPAQSYKHIPLWKVVDAYKGGDLKFIKDEFENKIIYVGTTATSLSDIKSVPTEPHLAGVELHATFLNNIMDNNFIQKTGMKIDFIVALFLSFVVGYLVLRLQSVIKTFVILSFVLVSYALLSVWIMQTYNIWIGIVIPYLAIIATFILIYCEKYLLKAKDYEQTYKLAVTDGLTQLYNHRYFQEQMITHVNFYRRYGTEFSLILIDIDFFKKFNDTYGHQSGDCVLKQVANILKKNSRTSDIACRYGGEEMSIILTNTGKDDAVVTANKICTMVRNNKFTLANGEKVNVTISVGVATVGKDGIKPQEIIEYSDKCLYYAKEHGRNQVVSEV